MPLLSVLSSIYAFNLASHVSALSNFYILGFCGCRTDFTCEFRLCEHQF